MYQENWAFSSKSFLEYSYFKRFNRIKTATHRRPVSICDWRQIKCDASDVGSKIYVQDSQWMSSIPLSKWADDQINKNWNPLQTMICSDSLVPYKLLTSEMCMSALASIFLKKNYDRIHHLVLKYIRVCLGKENMIC